MCSAACCDGRPGGFGERYGYRPLLVETFVTPDQRGTSLRGADSFKIGSTAGHGRQDRDNRFATGPRDVYMYELRPDWRQLGSAMGGPGT